MSAELELKRRRAAIVSKMKREHALAIMHQVACDGLKKELEEVDARLNGHADAAVVVPFNDPWSTEEFWSRLDERVVKQTFIEVYKRVMASDFDWPAKYGRNEPGDKDLDDWKSFLEDMRMGVVEFPDA